MLKSRPVSSFTTHQLGLYFYYPRTGWANNFAQSNNPDFPNPFQKAFFDYFATTARLSSSKSFMVY